MSALVHVLISEREREGGFVAPSTNLIRAYADEERAEDEAARLRAEEASKEYPLDTFSVIELEFVDT